MQTVPLSTHIEEHQYEYPFLEEYLTEQALERISELPYMGDEIKPIKLGYSLSCSQGDGVCFMEGKYAIKPESELYKKVIEIIETGNENKIKEVYDMDIAFYHNGRYYHEYSFTTAINVYVLFEDGTTAEEQYDWTDIYPNPDNHRIYANPFQKICQSIEKIGYEYIEEEDTQSILNNGFRAFLRANNIETDNDNLYDYEYTQIDEEAKEKFYTLVCTEGDTNLGNLYVGLPDIIEQTREEKYFIFK